MKHFQFLVFAVLILSLVVPTGQLAAATPQPEAPASEWIQLPPMPTGRAYLGADSLDGKFYVVAGNDSFNHPTDIIEAYAPVVNSWSTLAPLPEPRGVPMVAAAGGKLYVIGGLNGVAKSNVYQYDPSTNQWTERSSMPEARWSAGVAVINNLIYILAGVDQDDVTSNSVFIYDSVADTWSSGADIPALRAYSDTVVAWNDKIYFIGGISAGVASTQVDVYTPATDTWQTLNPLPEGRWGASTKAYNGKIYVVGGCLVGPCQMTNTVAVYRVADDTWETLTNIPYPVTSLGTAIINGKLYMAGGYDYSTYHNGLYSIDLNEGAVYGVSGTVSKSTGEALPGVSLSDGNGHSTMTDVNGAYTLTGLPGGTHTITPAMTGLSFTPASRTVALSVDTTGVNFIGNTIALSAIPPVKAHLDELVYVPVSLAGVLSSDDVRGVQVSVQVDNPSAFAPASGQSPEWGTLFPSESLTYATATSSGWDFMVTAPFSPVPAISGTGVIVELPFTALAEGCVNFTLTEHILTDSSAATINHQTSTGQICLVDQGNLNGTTYLQNRATGLYAGTLVTLNGPRGTYTATTDAAGKFAISDINSGTYTATFTHPLFLNAIRDSITLPGQVTTTLPVIGQWAGDMNQDGDVDEPDWYICAAASIPVDDPVFDINADGSTNIIDCTLLGGNIGRLNMPGTNPPATLAPTAVRMPGAAADISVGQIIVVPQENGDVVLRVVGVTGKIFATGTRLDLPAGASITGLELSPAFANGFLRWHQEADKLYVVAAPLEDNILTTDTDIVIIHITGGDTGEVNVEAESPVGLVITHKIFLPVLRQTN